MLASICNSNYLAAVNKIVKHNANNQIWQCVMSLHVFMYINHSLATVLLQLCVLMCKILDIFKVIKCNLASFKVPFALLVMECFEVFEFIEQ